LPDAQTFSPPADEVTPHLGPGATRSFSFSRINVEQCGNLSSNFVLFELLYRSRKIAIFHLTNYCAGNVLRLLALLDYLRLLIKCAAGNVTRAQSERAAEAMCPWTK
jgi:hypothetical protein